jgi:hypothetical protein
MPTGTVATYPLRLKAKTILDYQKIIEKAAWEDVTMRNEAEAALDAVLADKPGSWFPKTVALGDCGGSTHVSCHLPAFNIIDVANCKDWLVAYVEKVGEVITKGERMIYGRSYSLVMIIC